MSLSAVLCDVCGHENADRLTFCQECGRRLKSRDARVATPTPPQGVPAVQTAAEAGRERSGRSRPEPDPVAIARPAPTLGDGPAPPATKTRNPAEPATPPPAPSASALLCPTCGTSNPPMYRFCVTCGVTLPRDDRAAHAHAQAPAPPPIPAPPPAPPQPAQVAAMAHPVAAPHDPGALRGPAPAAPAAKPQPEGPRHAPKLEERIVGAPVVDIASGGGAPTKPVICPRCQGQNIPSGRYCQFCGASLGADAPAPVGSPPAAMGPTPIGARPGPTGRPDDEPRAPATVREPVGRASSSTPRGRLIVIEADGSEGMSFPLFDRPIDVGRTEGDVLVKEDSYVSPRHARLIPEGNRWILRDLASTNGVFLRIRKPHPLQDADLLLLGQEVLQFQLVSEPEKGLGHASQHGTLLFGSPVVPRPARLCQRSVEGVIRDVYHLHREETVIGRETGDIVFTSDPFLSRRHAMIRRAPARKDPARPAAKWDFTLSDLESSNGTFIAIRHEVGLTHGDFVRVGQHLFRVDFG